jgi:hypothetical protein
MLDLIILLMHGDATGNEVPQEISISLQRQFIRPLCDGQAPVSQRVHHVDGFRLTDEVMSLTWVYVIKRGPSISRAVLRSMCRGLLVKELLVPIDRIMASELTAG